MKVELANNADNIQAVVDAGYTVYAGTDAYVVVRDKIGQYFIKFVASDYAIGLTHMDGATLNDRYFYFYL